MTRHRALALTETTGSIAWFAMDASWMLDARIPCVVLAVPTLCFNLLAIAFTPRRRSPLLVAGAMAAWACMNVLWMTHDLGVLDGTYPLAAARVSLVLGVFMLGLSMAFDRAGPVHVLFGRFRRLRVRSLDRPAGRR